MYTCISVEEKQTPNMASAGRIVRPNLNSLIEILRIISFTTYDIFSKHPASSQERIMPLRYLYSQFIKN